MLMQEATIEMVNEWKAVFAEYRDKLSPNRKSASEILEYLKSKYTVVESEDSSLKQAVVDNVLSSDCFSEKLPAGKKPHAAIFFVENVEAGKTLYDIQDDIFKGAPIIAGVELETGYFQVEESSELWDELFAYRGLDLFDLENFYLVAEYVSCLKKYDKLSDALK